MNALFPMFNMDPNVQDNQAPTAGGPTGLKTLVSLVPNKSQPESGAKLIWLLYDQVIQAPSV